MFKSNLFINSLFALCLIITLGLYFYGLNGAYYFDDSHVINSNRFIKISKLDSQSLLQAASSFSPGGRQLSMLSFALNHYFFGDSTWWYKFMNLMIHGLNGIGLFVLTKQIIDKLNRISEDATNSILLYAPIAVVALWLVHPINLIPVLYISQRMTLLSAFFIIYGLVFYLWARVYIVGIVRKFVYLPLGIMGFTITGFACKENAILLPVFILLLECLILKFRNFHKQSHIDRPLVSLFILGSVAVVFVGVYLFFQNPGWVFSGYEYRYFSMEERLFTQFRVLIFYLYQIIIPSNNHLSLWHDDFRLSVGLLSPPTTLASLSMLIGILSIAGFSIKKIPLLSLGILWFFVAHSIESSIISLELIHEHRNYLASFGVLLALFALLVCFLKEKTVTILLLVFCLFIMFSMVLSQRANIWSNMIVHAQHEAENHPHSAIAKFELGKHYYAAAIQGFDGAEKLSFSSMQESANLEKHTIMAELFLVMLSEFDSIDYDSRWLGAAAEKLKKNPYMASSYVALNSFYRCIIDGNCNPPKEDMELLFDAAFDSDNHPLLTLAAYYYTDINTNYDRAEQAFERAIRDDVATWVNYLRYLLKREKFDKACSVFKNFQQKQEESKIKNLIFHFNEWADFQNKLNDCEVKSQE